MNFYLSVIKYSLLLVLLFGIENKIFCQEEDVKTRTITIVCADSTIQASMMTQRADFRPHSDVMYHWVHNDQIFVNRGDYAHYLLDGPAIIYDRQKRMIAKGEYKKGVRVGTWKYWHENGEIKSVGSWKGGRRQGTFYSYDTCGRQKSREKFKNGLLHGKCIYFSENIKTVIRYYRGIEKTPIKLFPAKSEKPTDPLYDEKDKGKEAKKEIEIDKAAERKKAERKKEKSTQEKKEKKEEKEE